MFTLIGALIVAAAIWWMGREVIRELRAARDEARRARAITIVSLFIPALSAVESDPRSLLAWAPAARSVRALFPDELAAIERALGAPFPFAPDRAQGAHAQWTADWLAWERMHDAEYKRKAAAAQEALAASGGAAARAEIDAIEHEKLDRYQRRYEEYIRVAKALQAVQF